MSHFRLLLPKRQLHLKCDDYDQKARWVLAIRFLSAKYSSARSFEERKYKERTDDETSLRIIAENETRHWAEMEVG